VELGIYRRIKALLDRRFAAKTIESGTTTA
jgi:hypothetical protein